MLPSQTSIADALSVPELAQACCEALCHGRHGGRKCDGLKHLREVSKEISIRMLAHVRRYTLRLEASEWKDKIEAVTFLQETRLSQLFLELAPAQGNKPGYVSEASLPMLQKQLGRFIIRMGPALSTVTSLDLVKRRLTDAEEVQSEKHQSLEEKQLLSLPISKLVSQLAPACPALTSLGLFEHVHEDALHAFKTYCPLLTHLYLEPYCLEIHLLQQLQQLLPNVFSVDIHGKFSQNITRNQTYVCSAVLSLAANTCITELRIGIHNYMEHAMWANLPPSLKLLSCCEGGGRDWQDEDAWKGPAEGVCLPHLKCVKWRCTIQGAHRLLLAAPNLQQLDRWMEADADPDVVPSWNAVCARVLARVLAGLQGIKDLSLYVDEGSEFLSFMCAAQPMLSVKKVVIRMSPDNILARDADYSTHIARVFPCLEDFDCDKLPMVDDSLHKLLACHHLRELSLSKCHDLTGEGVGMMVASHSSLRKLIFCDCDGIDYTTRNRLNRLIQVYGKQVRVSVQKMDG